MSLASKGRRRTRTREELEADLARLGLEPFLDPGHLCAMLNCSRQELYRKRRLGQLPKADLIGGRPRWPVSRIKEWLAEVRAS